MVELCYSTDFVIAKRMLHCNFSHLNSFTFCVLKLESNEIVIERENEERELTDLSICRHSLYLCLLLRVYEPWILWCLWWWYIFLIILEIQWMLKYYIGIIFDLILSMLFLQFFYNLLFFCKFLVCIHFQLIKYFCCFI